MAAALLPWVGITGPAVLPAVRLSSPVTTGRKGWSAGFWCLTATLLQAPSPGSGVRTKISNGIGVVDSTGRVHRRFPPAVKNVGRRAEKPGPGGECFVGPPGPPGTHTVTLCCWGRILLWHHSLLTQRAAKRSPWTQVALHAWYVHVLLMKF